MTDNISASNLQKAVLISIVQLHLDKSTNELLLQPEYLRGAIAGMFPSEIMLHQHNENGKVRYNYPLIQYKFIGKNCLLVGIENGARLISNLDLTGEIIALSREKCKILKRDILIQELSFGIMKTIFSYSFLTPWLALNEENYKKYKNLAEWKEKKELLEKILVGNIISMSKGLGYTVPEPIKANISRIREVPTSLKGTPMIGFLGSFSVNFEIPDYFGLGKSVSRGFGTVKRIK